MSVKKFSSKKSKLAKQAEPAKKIIEAAENNATPDANKATNKDQGLLVSVKNFFSKKPKLAKQAEPVQKVELAQEVIAATENNATPELVFTDNAANKVKELLAEENDPNLKLRAFISGGGCSGFQYGFTFDEEQNDDDFVFEKNGVKLLVDVMSMQYLTNAEIDYKEDETGEQFVIRNPNAQTTCGCGSSFSA